MQKDAKGDIKGKTARSFLPTFGFGSLSGSGQLPPGPGRPEVRRSGFLWRLLDQLFDL